MYVDGDPVTDWQDDATPSDCAYFSSVQTVTTVIIGGDDVGNFAPDNFYIDELTLWDTALTHNYVKALYQGHRSPLELFNQ